MSLWGCNVKMESLFTDTEVKLKGAKWWRDHKPVKGEPNARMCDFREYMLGLPLVKGLLQEFEKSTYSEEMFRQFTIQLGFSHQSLRQGTFSDEHESDANQRDRRNRFLPEYFYYYNKSPHLYHGEEVDELADIDVRNRHFVHVKGTDGKMRKINLGGELPPGGHCCLLMLGPHPLVIAVGDGPVYLLASHDE